jgi:hypothetical protein
LLEAQVVLGLFHRQLSIGLDRDALREAFASLDAARLRRIARERLVPERRSTLLLRPAR